TTSGAVEVTQLDAPATADALPLAIVNYALRTGEKVLSDADSSNPFEADPYVSEQRPRSYLCVPIVLSGKVMGALYLEYTLAVPAFPPERLIVLELLASQAAASLENARLYTDLRRAQQYMSRAERLGRTGSFSWKPVSGDVFWSDEVYRIFGIEGTPT